MCAAVQGARLGKHGGMRARGGGRRWAKPAARRTKGQCTLAAGAAAEEQIQITHLARRGGAVACACSLTAERAPRVNPPCERLLLLRSYDNPAAGPAGGLLLVCL